MIEQTPVLMTEKAAIVMILSFAVLAGIVLLLLDKVAKWFGGDDVYGERQEEEERKKGER